MSKPEDYGSRTEDQIRCRPLRLEVAEALAIAAEGAQFDQLFTDTVMAGGVNGRQLAEQMAASRPSLRVVFTSG